MLRNILFVGGGKMGEAMITGLLNSKLYEAHEVIVCEKNKLRSVFLEKKFGVKESPLSRVKDCKITVLAVKPQDLGDVLKNFPQDLNSENLCLSIVAGATIDKIRELTKFSSIVRSMPNIPAILGKSTTAWTCTSETSKHQKDTVSGILSAIGTEHFVEKEDYIDMATALSGSGPAYFYLIVEAMIDAGVAMGIPRSLASKLVIETMSGSSHLISKLGDPVSLRNDITSPGGTTAAALYVAEKGGLRTVLTDAVFAAYNRSKNLNK